MRYLPFLLLLLPTLAHAEYPTPAQAGFHHCALIYEAPTRGVAELMPYVADEHGWLFDSFLFLRQSTSKGVSNLEGQTRMPDWQEHFTRWFGKDRDLAALDETIEQATKRLGPVARRPIMLSIPYPSALVKDFGDVDGDGQSEDLSTPQGQEKVARWYVAEAQRQFAAAGFRHLSLWGLYWMNEGVSDSEKATMRTYSRAIHDAGLRFLWIPWYHAPNWRNWRELGFDVAIMQPNYAFLETHHGNVRRNRLAVNATDAREGGLGVEIELPMTLSIPGSPRLFLEYLRDGAASRYGYQQAATAYYLGSQWIEKLAAARDPLYAALAAYVRGETVPEPDAARNWMVGGKSAPFLGDQDLSVGRPISGAEAAFPASQSEALDVFFDEPGEPWTGMIRVEGRTAGGQAWQPAGWLLRSSKVADDGRFQVATVPLCGTWTQLRVSFDGETPPNVAELTAQPPTLGGCTAHLAYRKRYQVYPAEAARYGDDGYELTDGVIPEKGFSSGKTVGWSSLPVAVTVDLGEVMDIEKAELCLQYDEGAAVFYPRSSLVMLSTDNPPPGHPNGMGAAPANFAWIAPGAPVIDYRRSDTDFDAHIPFVPSRPVRARYVTFLAQANVWLMLSEIRVFSGGRNVVLGKPYTLQPAPAAVRGYASYPDDGQLLTDGIVASGFSIGTVYGWSDGKERTIEVDLAREARLDEVTVWSVTGSHAGIYLPSAVKLAVSDDGKTWEDVGAATAGTAPDEPSTACPFTLKLKGQKARYLRAVVTPSKGWSMVSEIQVCGKEE